MNAKIVILILLITGLLSGCNQSTQKKDQKDLKTDNSIVGKWVRIGQSGPIGFDFKKNGLVEGDFGNDKSIDVVDGYELTGDTIKFVDKEGQMCQGYGLYKIYQTDYYLAFDLIEDNCGGRIKTTMGYWTRPNFNDFLTILDNEISNSPNQKAFLNRARIYMALGKSQQAREDLDSFILNDTTNARVYINRAGTRFPDDLEGAVLDCNKAISLEPDNKNAYFLRGLARYDLGEQELGCEDFTKAIELGFSVLKIAEQEKCAEFWDEK